MQIVFAKNLYRTIAFAVSPPRNRFPAPGSTKLSIITHLWKLFITTVVAVPVGEAERVHFVLDIEFRVFCRGKLIY